MPITFQDELVGLDAQGHPEGFFDRFMFNLHGTDACVPSILFGAGLYPNQDVVDGFVVLVTATEQRNLRFASELSTTGGTHGGPLSWGVVEPMRSWQLTLDSNPTGLAFDLNWTARAPAWFGDVTVATGSATTAFEHLFQSGRYRGTVSIDGRRSSVDGWYGQRDRSRGVRTMAGGQGLHLWYQAQFPDRSVGFLYVEDRAHRTLLLKGAVMHEGGDVDDIVEVRHALTFDDQLDLVSGRVALRTAAGSTYLIDGDASARGGYMAGAGYGGHHGKPMGHDHVEHDVYALNGSVSPRTLDSALTDRLTSFDWEGTPGIGILEFAVTRSGSFSYRPSPGV